MYNTGSLRESCKILIKGYNKECLLGCMIEHLVHDPVCFSAEICVRCHTGCYVHAVFLAEIYLGYSDWLYSDWPLRQRKTVRSIIHVYHNDSVITPSLWAWYFYRQGSAEYFYKCMGSEFQASCIFLYWPQLLYFFRLLGCRPPPRFSFFFAFQLPPNLVCQFSETKSL